MTILITGATGAVGRILIQNLLEQGHSVRALTRRPETAALPEKVDVVRGDVNAADGLEAKIFDDVESVFVFPVGPGVAHLTESAVAAGVPRFVVFSSLAAAGERPRERRSVSYRHHLAVEQAVLDRAEDVALLRPGTFASNLLHWAYAVRSGLPVRDPYPESAQAPVHEADIAEAAAHLLTASGQAGLAYPLTGPQALTRRQQAQAIADAVGTPIAVEEITEEQFRQDVGRFMPKDIITMLLEYWRESVTEPDVPQPLTAITGGPGRTLAQWARDHRVDFVNPS